MLAALNAVLAARIDGCDRPKESEQFAVSFALASRRAGRAALELASDEKEALRKSGIDWPLTGWNLDDLARVALLVGAAQRLSPVQLVNLAEQTFRQGDSREKAAILRALPLLSHPTMFLPLALEGCRSTALPVFEAIACENPFPGAHFPAHPYNHLVLKAVFMGVDVARLIGLELRLSPELSVMASDYAAERTATGRSVPSDLWKLIGERAEAR